MNGAHDMGGTHGFGAVVQEEDEPYFHAPWEARAFAMTLASGGGRWNIDMSRFAREDVAPADYLTRSYYEIWFHGLVRLLVEHGVVTAEEIEAAQTGATFEPVAEPSLEADEVPMVMRQGGSTRVDEDVAPQFNVGQRVRASSEAPRTHTRCPRYVRGRQGVIDRDHGVFIFPDTNAHGAGPKPQHVYAVRFEAEELWGSTNEGGAVYVDLWDDYLEAT